MPSPLENTAVSRPRPADSVPGYRLEGVLGRGGMGEVHRATQLSLGRTVAIKLLSTQLAQDATFVARFEKEAAALASLSHPHIVAIVDKGKADDTYYLVMEYVDGPSLREVLRSPTLNPANALRIALDICRAIDYAHGRGVIHRDLKPENILFDEQAGGLAKVTDFGLADFLDGRGPTRFNVTQTHMGMGTASYMAPEQRVDAKNADQRADIYSLGVMLYELLTGEVPVGHFDPPSLKRPGIDRRLDVLIARCLRPLPDERYAQVSHLIAELEPLVPQGTSSLRRPGPKERLVAQLRQAVRVVTRAAAGATVVAALGVLGVAALRSRARPLEPSAGEALTLETLAKGELLDAHWRLDTEVNPEVYALGQGDTSLPLHPYGRGVTLENGAIVFPGTTRAPLAGRAGPDFAGTDAQGLELEAVLTPALAEEGAFTRLRHLVWGTRQRPRGALLLLGHPGRYVALVAPMPGEPLTLEWKLGERQGTMLGPSLGTNTRPVRLALRVSALGEVRASIGARTDERPVGEPVLLGIDWQRHFGGTPSPAVGCLEGSCRFDNVRYRVEEPPPPLPPPEPEPEPAPIPPSPKVAPSLRKPAMSKRPPPRSVNSKRR